MQQAEQTPAQTVLQDLRMGGDGEGRHSETPSERASEASSGGSRADAASASDGGESKHHWHVGAGSGGMAAAGGHAHGGHGGHHDAAHHGHDDDSSADVTRPPAGTGISEGTGSWVGGASGAVDAAGNGDVLDDADNSAK